MSCWAFVTGTVYERRETVRACILHRARPKSTWPRWSRRWSPPRASWRRPVRKRRPLAPERRQTLLVAGARQRFNDSNAALVRLRTRPRRPGAPRPRHDIHRRPPVTTIAAHRPAAGALPRRLRGTHQPPQAPLRPAPQPSTRRGRGQHLGRLGVLRERDVGCDPVGAVDRDVDAHWSVCPLNT
jgi:hypothetical protein